MNCSICDPHKKVYKFCMICGSAFCEEHLAEHIQTWGKEIENSIVEIGKESTPDAPIS